MTASAKTRYHESGHALAAHRLGMLHEIGVVLNSDLDAYVCVVEEDDGTRCWAAKRIAIKLAGPIGRILQQGEPLHWDTLRLTPEYARDFEEAKEMALRAVAILIEAMAADMRLGLVAPVVEAEPQRKDR